MPGAEGAELIDDIARQCGLNSCEVLATLLELELKSAVRQLPGEQFTKILL
jgi:predicted Rossmann fold nucleotide-binding protein DprA/Smf involved in DNA uptake